MIVVAVALAAALAGALSLIAWLIYKLVRTKDELADSRVADQLHVAELAIKTSDIETQSKRADAEKQKAERLYDVLRKMPRGNARDWVLSQAALDNPDASDRDGAGAVHPEERPEAEAPPTDPDGLIVP